MDNIIEQEKQLEVEDRHLAETKVAIQILSSGVEQLDIESKNLKEDLEVWEADYESIKSIWNEKKGHSQELVSNPDAARQNRKQLKLLPNWLSLTASFSSKSFASRSCQIN